MALATLDKIKSLLGITTSAKDSQLAALLLAAEQTLKTDLDRNLESATYTEFYSGTGTRNLCLRETPVSSITSLWLNFSGYYGQNPDSGFTSEVLLEQGKHYLLRIDKDSKSFSGIVERIGTVWSEIRRAYTQASVTQEASPAQGNIKVMYVAGYASIPEDIQWALALTVRRMQQYAKTGFLLEKEKLRDYMYELMPLAKQALYEVGGLDRILRMYKKVPF